MEEPTGEFVSRIEESKGARNGREGERGWADRRSLRPSATARSALSGQRLDAESKIFACLNQIFCLLLGRTLRPRSETLFEIMSYPL